MTDSAEQLVSLVDVREHARRRRPWNRAFSVPALREYEEAIARRAEQLVEVFVRHAEQGRPANAGKCVGSFTYVSVFLAAKAKKLMGVELADGRAVWRF